MFSLTLSCREAAKPGAAFRSEGALGDAAPLHLSPAFGGYRAGAAVGMDHKSPPAAALLRNCQSSRELRRYRGSWLQHAAGRQLPALLRSGNTKPVLNNDFLRLYATSTAPQSSGLSQSLSNRL